MKTPLSILYYPYDSLYGCQAVLLKVTMLYFNKLIILDPDIASGDTVGAGEVAKDDVGLEQTETFDRAVPEDVLLKFEEATADRYWGITDFNLQPNVGQLGIIVVEELTGTRDNRFEMPRELNRRNALTPKI